MNELVHCWMKTKFLSSLNKLILLGKTLWPKKNTCQLKSTEYIENKNNLKIEKCFFTTE